MQFQLDQSGGVVLDTLRISDHQWLEIVAGMDRVATAATKRQHRPRVDVERVRFRTMLVVRVTHPGGTRERFLVRARNISAGGMSFLHGSFLHATSDCVVTIIGADGKSVEIAASVVRCRLVSGKVHEVGVAFDSPVDVNPYVEDHDLSSR